MAIVNINPVPPRGLRALQYARNGAITDGPNMTGLAAFINMLRGRRMKVLCSKMCGPSQFLVTAGDVGTCQFYVSPFAASVGVLMLCAPTNSATVHGSYFWTVDGVAQTSVDLGATTATVTPDSYFVKSQTFVDGGGANLTGDASHTALLTLSTTAQVRGFIIYERARTSLDTGTGAGVATDQYSIGDPITDTNISLPTDAMWSVFASQGTHHIHWTEHRGSGAPTVTGATFKNVLDQGTGGYASTAAGFWTIPYRQGRQTGTTVEVTCWCYAQGSGSGSVKFTNSAGTIATISSIGAKNFYTATGTLDPTISGSDLVIVEQNDSGGSITTYGVGMYDLAT